MKPVHAYNAFVQLLAHTYSTPFPTKIKGGVSGAKIIFYKCTISVSGNCDAMYSAAKRRWHWYAVFSGRVGMRHHRF